MKILLGLVLLCILATAVSANIELVEDVVTLDVDYSGFNDEYQETVAETTSAFTLKNTGSEEVITTITLTNLPADYVYTSKNITVPAAVDGVAGEVSTTLSIDVSHDENSGETNIAIIALSGSTDTATLRQVTKSMLDLTNIKVEYTNDQGNAETDNFDGEDKTFDLEENVQPFTEMSFTFKYRNLFDKDYDTDKSDIENIELTIQSDDDDIFDGSFEEDYDLGDLGAGDKDEFTVTFNIDEDADAKDYTFDITLRTEDSNGVKHKIDRELTFEVKHEKDDVRIIQSTVLPTSLTKCDTSFTMDVTLKNFGSDRQRYAALSIYNEELDINENIETIELDKNGNTDDTWNRLFTFTLPTNVKVKKYSLDVRAYIDNDEVMDIENVDVDIKSCVQNVPEEEEEIVVVTPPSDDTTTTETGTTGTTTGSGSESSAVTSAAVVHTIEDPYTTEDIVVAILIIAVVLVLVLIVAFMIILLK